MLWTIIFLLSTEVVTSSLSIWPEKTSTFIFYHGPTFLESETYELSKASAILQHPKFDSTKKTVLYLHGYLENPEVESIQVIVEAYLKRNDHNTIILDWHEDASGSYVLNAVPRMKRLGPAVANALLIMIDSGLNVDLLHVVGHSLGGQLAGSIGREIKHKSSNRIALKRISGLDPAFPLFYPSIMGKHISKDDAEFVDIIHTDSWLYGAPSSTGTVDFWPNGGKTLQPGCPKRNFRPLSDNDLCSHRRSWRFWAESVAKKYPQKFNAVKAQSWKDFKSGKTGNADVNVVMGIDCSIGLFGDYYLQTNGDSPYAKGSDGTLYTKNNKEIKLDGNSNKK